MTSVSGGKIANLRRTVCVSIPVSNFRRYGVSIASVLANPKCFYAGMGNPIGVIRLQRSATWCRGSTAQNRLLIMVNIPHFANWRLGLQSSIQFNHGSRTFLTNLFTNQQSNVRAKLSTVSWLSVTADAESKKTTALWKYRIFHLDFFHSFTR